MSLRSWALALLLGAPAAISAAEQAPAATDRGAAQLWEDWRASGTWRSNYYSSSKSLDDATGFLGSTAQLKVLPTLTDSVDGKVEARVTNAAIGEGGDTKTRLLEAYATIQFEKADLHIGRQIVAWGRADGINPTDNVSPRDFTVMLPFEDDQRFGADLLKLDLYLTQEHTLTIVGTPFFEPSQVSLPPTLRRSEIEPASTASNTQGGFRLNKVGEGFDWSVSHLRGFSLTPTVRLLGADAVELHYDRTSVFGADFARNFGRFGVRGEVAYIDTSDDGGDPAVKDTYLFWIAGVDRTFFEYLNVNLQFFQRRVRHYQDPRTIADPFARATAELNALVNGLPERVSEGISFRVSNRWFNENLEAEIFAAINFNGSNAFLRPLVTYKFNDRWKGTIGAEIYTGNADTQYGSLKDNRGGFAELRYGF